MRQYKNYTDDDFIEAWTTSGSIRQVLGKFEKSLSKHDLRNNVDWSKFLSYIYS